MSVKIRFAGDLAQNNKVSMWTLSHTLINIERAFERAYLDIERGGIRKNEKMSKPDYSRAILLLEDIEYSSIGLKFSELTSDLIPVVNRIIKAALNPYEKSLEKGELELSDIKEQINIKKRILETNGIESLQTYSEFIKNPGDKILREFGDRSINKYIDQAIIPARKNKGQNIIEIELKGDQSYTFTFNNVIAERFGKIITHKDLGEPFVLISTLLSADNKNLKAKVHNTISRRQMNVFFTDLEDLKHFSPYIGNKGEPFQFIAAPIIESGSYDLTSGDVYFLKFLV